MTYLRIVVNIDSRNPLKSRECDDKTYISAARSNCAPTKEEFFEDARTSMADFHLISLADAVYAPALSSFSHVAVYTRSPRKRLAIGPALLTTRAPWPQIWAPARLDMVPSVDSL